MARQRARPAGRRAGPAGILQALCVLLLLCLSAFSLAIPAAGQEDLPPALTAPPEEQPQEDPSPAIEPGVDPAEDEAIAQRLRTIYDTVEGLSPVRVRVASGVVVLTGEVSSQALREQAVRLAGNVRGVAEVENRIVVARDLEGRLAPALRQLQDAWIAFVRLLPVLLVGLVIMAAAVLVGRWLGRRRALRRLAANAFIATLLAQAVQGLVLIIGAALTLLLLDATGLVNTLLGAAGLVGLALGFALRDTLENYIASILLSLRRPFDPEDFVQIEEHEGIVVRLTSRATVLLTLDGNQVRIPNATVFKGLIVNFSSHPQRRFTIQLGVAPGADLTQAQQVALAALADVDGVLTEPPPSALYMSVGDSAVNLLVAGWMDQGTHDFLRVRSEAIRVVLTRMDEAGIDLPEPTLRLRRAPEPAPPPAKAPERPAQAPVGQPLASATARDASLARVVERERAGRSNLLDPESAHE